MGSDQKRFIIAIALSGLVLLLWQTYFAPKFERPANSPSAQQTPMATNNSLTTPSSAPDQQN
ncbi:MAG: hypothetical protein WCG27_10525, partial [Pseudomonadota bacterium]